MAVNSIFKTNNLAAIESEQNLYSDLIKEAIQIYGHDVYYIDRTLIARDNVLGEDSLSKFTTQHPIEMYVEDATTGYAGEKEIITQFGLENRNEITFVVNKKRFQEMDSQVTLEDGTDTTGGSILLESGSIDQSSNFSVLTTVSGDNNFYLLLDTTSTDADRPQEGDLIYSPIVTKMFEISFVDHDEPFHQLDNNPVYKLRCKQFEYSQERIDTGITELDSIETNLSTDTGLYQFTLEQSSTYNEKIRIKFSVTTSDGLLLDETDGDNIIIEDETTSAGENIILEQAADTGDKSYLLQETYIVGDASTTTTDLDKSAQNELFDQLDDTVIDFSETNPFGDVGGT
tara:strand:- start:1362 stop:2393 length:1032 start_codon:yes stop_codon:yes gene_type:complete